MTPTPQGQAEPTDIASKLRDRIADLRRKPIPLAEMIPLMQQAADALDALAASHAAPADLRAASVPVAVLRQHWLRAMECDHVEKRDKPHCACSLTDLGWHPSIGGAVEAWLEHVHAAAQLAAVAAPWTSEHCKHGICDEEDAHDPKCKKDRRAAVAAPPKLAVWYGPMPESNGRTNWTAMLHREGSLDEGFTISRSEYPHRVRYEADAMRHLIGELADAPDILAYDSDERTPCHLCGGTGEKDGKPCWGLNFDGTVHKVAAVAAPDARMPLTEEQIDRVLGAAYRKLVLETGYTGGMGSESWDRAAARAVEAAHGIAPPVAQQEGSTQ